ncbi:hypothetical protein LB503_013551 [Fusarium chuoi]|nr:hypothetical protein LB503_013551 [Fusarium chuoi]
MSLTSRGVQGLQQQKPEWHAPWKLMRVISGHLGWVRSLAVEPGNKWFASGAGDRTIKIWDLATGSLRLTLTGHISTCPLVILISSLVAKTRWSSAGISRLTKSFVITTDISVVSILLPYIQPSMFWSLVAAMVLPVSGICGPEVTFTSCLATPRRFPILFVKRLTLKSSPDP